MKKNIREILHLPARNQMKRYTRSKAGNFFYFLFLFAAGVFSLLPMIYCVVTSLKPLDELLVFPPDAFHGKKTHAFKLCCAARPYFKSFGAAFALYIQHCFYSGGWHCAYGYILGNGGVCAFQNQILNIRA